MRVQGRLTTAPRVAWELANGPIPQGATIIGCPDDKSCVRVDHLTLNNCPAANSRTKGTPRTARRSRPGGGTMRQVRPGIWKLTVDLGRDSTGRRRRTSRTVAASGPTAASKALAVFVHEKRGTTAPTASPDDLPPGVTVNALVDGFLTQHLLQQRRHEHPRDCCTIR